MLVFVSKLSWVVVAYMALVIVRIQIFAVPARGKKYLRTHLLTRLLAKTYRILAGVGADVGDGALGLVLVVI